MSEFCPKCGKQTPSVFNDFMVSFCAVCHTRRNHQPSLKAPFKCVECGAMSDERFIGQTVCEECERSLKNE